jgi:hypothetical protein
MLRRIFILFFVISFNVFSAEPISIHKSWTLFRVNENEKEICYIASLPIEKKGNYKKRGEPYLLIMRMMGNDFDEVTLSSGFIYDEEKDIEVTILKRKFPLFSHEEKAWTYDRNDDVEIVKQMKNGAKMYVVGYSKAGTFANDTYSLMGFNEAYEKMIILCKKNQYGKN